MFYEEENINKALTCIKCSQRLYEPRNLPCGESICYYCYESIISIKANNKTFKCFVCNEDHLMPEKGLPISKRLMEILSLESKEVYRSKEVKKLKELVSGFQQDINKFSFGINNGVDQIKELCIELKSKVQLKTEEAIEQLNEHSHVMIKEIEKFEKDSIRLYQANKKKSNEFEKIKQELEEFNHKWNTYLKQSVISDEIICDAIAQANELEIKTKQDLAKLNEFIFQCGQMKFKKNESKLDKLVLGLLEKKKFIVNSTKIKFIVNFN